jgi:hypothetical protein
MGRYSLIYLLSPVRVVGTPTVLRLDGLGFDGIKQVNKEFN